MKKSKPIRVDNLRIGNRLPGRTHDNTELALDIETNGLRFPVVVSSDMTIIDGLRRTNIARAQGLETVDTVVCDEFEDTCVMLSKTTNADGQPPPWRIYELFMDTNQQQKDRGTRLRRKKANERVPGLRSREMFTTTLKLSNEGVISAIVAVYRAFYEDSDYSDAKLQAVGKIQDDLESGLITVYEARGMIQRLDLPQGMSGDIVGMASQRAALTTSLSQLAGFTKGVSKLGPLSPDFERFELELLLRGFEDERRHVIRFIKQFKERINEL